MDTGRRQVDEVSQGISRAYWWWKPPFHRQFQSWGRPRVQTLLASSVHKDYVDKVHSVDAVNKQETTISLFCYFGHMLSTLPELVYS